MYRISTSWLLIKSMNITQSCSFIIGNAFFKLETSSQDKSCANKYEDSITSTYMNGKFRTQTFISKFKSVKNEKFLRLFKQNHSLSKFLICLVSRDRMILENKLVSKNMYKRLPPVTGDFLRSSKNP